ncbi:hypothetical protein FGO68_gene2430 [Halteria grandinella]|uniref:N-alpha-acetyltransferase 60 n=1 Tax=Halteria grandinella TaxID=5974 RepID=A0A8J8P6I7_HALGN|nr:hypothetical protein FGO68_gene2430 [Halteria grandinella]
MFFNHLLCNLIHSCQYFSFLCLVCSFCLELLLPLLRFYYLFSYLLLYYSMPFWHHNSLLQEEVLILMILKLNENLQVSNLAFKVQQLCLINRCKAAYLDAIVVGLSILFYQYKDINSNYNTEYIIQNPMASALIKKTISQGSKVVLDNLPLSQSSKRARNLVQYEEFEEQTDDQSAQYQEAQQNSDGQDDSGLEFSHMQEVRLSEEDLPTYHEQEEQKQSIRALPGVKKGKAKVKSDAWPVEMAQQNAMKAEVHRQINENVDRLNLKNIYFRQLEEGDIQETKRLHEEWFPLNYEDSFYNRISKANIIAIGCFVKIRATLEQPTEKELMLGVILTKVQYHNDEVREIMNQRERDLNTDTGLFGWLRWFKSIVSCRGDHVGAYIMTIGVIDECRRLGLGTQLIERTIKVLNRDFPACAVLYLHVVTYNESAIRFYLNERNRFVRYGLIKDHYVIFEKNYDAVSLYKIIGPVNRTDGDESEGLSEEV